MQPGNSKIYVTISNTKIIFLYKQGEASIINNDSHLN